jgi:hypothetical protein
MDRIIDFYLLINEETFERMQSLDELDFDSYDQFLNWNIACMEVLSDEDLAWIEGLCSRIKNQSVALLTGESQNTYTASNIYFDRCKKLCIMTPH